MRLFVCELPDDMTADCLKKYFSKFGNVVDSFIKMRDGESLCFGFVQFDSDHAYRDALQSSRHNISGKSVVVKKACQKPQKRVSSPKLSAKTSPVTSAPVSQAVSPSLSSASPSVEPIAIAEEPIAEEAEDGAGVQVSLFLPRFALLRNTIDAVTELVKQADKFEAPIAEALFQAIDHELISSSKILHELDCDLLSNFRIVLRMAKNVFDQTGDEEGFKQSVKNIF